MEADGHSHPWPEDMERRRLAALQKFQRKNPDFKVMSDKLLGTSRIRIEGEKCFPSSVNRLSSVTKKGRPNNNENRWCLATTLELLEEMKAYVRANKLRCLGEDMEKWKAIAIRLTNPCGLELRRLARSSMVRFDNLRRYFRGGRVGRMGVEIQDSLVEYFQICERELSPGSKKTPSKLSTVKLALTGALNYGRASPSPPPTPAAEKFYRPQTVMDSRESWHDDDYYPMSPADYSSNGSDDDAIGFGNLHRASKDMETLFRMPPQPAAESESSDQEDVGKSYGAVSRVARNGLTTRLPEPSTPSALMLSRTLTYG